MKRFFNVGNMAIIEERPSQFERQFGIFCIHIVLTFEILLLLLVIWCVLSLFAIPAASLFMNGDAFLKLSFFNFMGMCAENHKYIYLFLLVVTPVIIILNKRFYQTCESPVAFRCNGKVYYRSLLRRKRTIRFSTGGGVWEAGDLTGLLLAFGIKKELSFGHVKDNPDEIVAWCPWCRQIMTLEEATKELCPHCRHKNLSSITPKEKRKFVTEIEVE